MNFIIFYSLAIAFTNLFSEPAQKESSEEMLQKIINIKRAEKELHLFDLSSKKILEQEKIKLEKQLGLMHEERKNQGLISNFLSLIPIWVWQLSLLALLLILLSSIFLSFVQIRTNLFFVIMFAFVANIIMVMSLQTRFAAQAFVSAKTANLYSGPGDNYPIVAPLGFGRELCIIKEKGGYAHVQSQAEQGWIDLLLIEKV